MGAASLKGTTRTLTGDDWPGRRPSGCSRACITARPYGMTLWMGVVGRARTLSGSASLVRTFGISSRIHNVNEPVVETARPIGSWRRPAIIGGHPWESAASAGRPDTGTHSTHASVRARFARSPVTTGYVGRPHYQRIQRQVCARRVGVRRRPQPRVRSCPVGSTRQPLCRLETAHARWDVRRTC